MRRTIVLLATMALTLLVASGVALAVNKIGGPGPDVLRGTDNRDRLEGKGGPDALFGLGAGDCLAGGNGPDTLEGGPGPDNMRGGPVRSGPHPCEVEGLVERPAASDVMRGGPGADVMTGNRGADVIRGGRGDDQLADGEVHRGALDALFGSAGDDTFYPGNDPSRKDVVFCGSGHDEVFADHLDVVSGDCEVVHR